MFSQVVGPAAVAGDDVVEIEFPAVEVLGAILAGVLVALENVVPGELHFLVRQPVEKQEHDRLATAMGLS